MKKSLRQKVLEGMVEDNELKIEYLKLQNEYWATPNGEKSIGVVTAKENIVKNEKQIAEITNELEFFKSKLEE